MKKISLVKLINKSSSFISTALGGLFPTLMLSPEKLIIGKKKLMKACSPTCAALVMSLFSVIKLHPPNTMTELVQAGQ